jgi:hypothetical protein
LAAHPVGFLIALSLTCLISSAAEADYLKGQGLLDACSVIDTKNSTVKNSSDAKSRHMAAQCLDFVFAAAETIRSINYSQGRCRANIPDDEHVAVFVAKVVKYLRNHANGLTEYAQIIAVEALTDAYPCPK